MSEKGKFAISGVCDEEYIESKVFSQFTSFIWCAKKIVQRSAQLKLLVQVCL